MACGLPVIAKLVPGIAEIMGDESPSPGFALPIANVPALRDALEKLLSDFAVSRELGILAKKRAQDFSLASVGKQLRDFLLAHTNFFRG